MPTLSILVALKHVHAAYIRCPREAKGIAARRLFSSFKKGVAVHVKTSMIEVNHKSSHNHVLGITAIGDQPIRKFKCLLLGGTSVVSPQASPSIRHDSVGEITGNLPIR
jgi:hypothetical protein